MPYKSLIIIGLTGNIACGKSTVLAILRELGASTIDADAVTHTLQQPGQAVYQQIVEAFGPSILTEPDGAINRQALGAIVFSNPAELRRLEQIVHPAVRAHVWAWLDALAEEHAPSALQPQTSDHLVSLSSGHSRKTSGVAVIDAIKLIEAGWPTICDSLWVVTCPPEQQLTRLMATRGMSEAEAQRRIAAQPPQSEKVARATVVIDNSGNLAETRRQVEAAWQAVVTSIRL